MYSDRYSTEIQNKLLKLKKKDLSHYQIVRKKMQQILENPGHRYKFLRYDMKQLQRVHLGHFVLVFSINHKNKVVDFYDYDHHNKIYKRD